MCAIKEVKVVSDDQSSKESLKQLNQVLPNTCFPDLYYQLLEKEISTIKHLLFLI